MAGNLVKLLHMTVLTFTDIFSILSFVFVRLGFRLLCVRLASHSFAVHLVSGSLISKPHRQRLKWMCTRAL